MVFRKLKQSKRGSDFVESVESNMATVLDVNVCPSLSFPFKSFRLPKTQNKSVSKFKGAAGVWSPKTHSRIQSNVSRANIQRRR